jgi:hypothetical protein
LHRARGEERCLRLKAEKKDVIDKWIIAFGKRERMARGRMHNQSAKVQGLNLIPEVQLGHRETTCHRCLQEYSKPGTTWVNYQPPSQLWEKEKMESESYHHLPSRVEILFETRGLVLSL